MSRMTGLLIAAAVALFVGGTATGYALNNRQAAVIEEQSVFIGSLQSGQATLLEAAQRPVVLDAELKAGLAQVPPACISGLGGDPLSAQCLLQTCWQYGQSSAQRPDCDVAERLVSENMPEAPISL